MSIDEGRKRISIQDELLPQCPHSDSFNGMVEKILNSSRQTNMISILDKKSGFISNECFRRTAGFICYHGLSHSLCLDQYPA